ncbi:alpha/beta hydrolase [Streptomyces sp. NPDC047097]|uniref:alpha/beta hydrolase n=1 Tax=Streptomyces sp. NPDC047097 TaxID=3155260 RepID=UPI0033ED850A
MTATALDWQRLHELRPADFEAAGNRWHAVSSRAGADALRVGQAMSAQLRETQRGDAATAALRRLRRLHRNLDYVRTECGLVRTTLNGLAADLAEPQRQLRLALDEAAELGFTVHPDGSITYPASTAHTLLGPQDTPAGQAAPRAALPLDLPHSSLDSSLRPLNPHADRAQALADRIARAVRAAAEIDARYTRTLNGLRAAKGLDITAATLRDVRRDTADVRHAASAYLAADVPFDATPAERKAWWDALTDEQRQEFLRIAPDLVGNLDGIPAAARDQANRAYLPTLIEELAGRHDDASQTKLEALRLLQARLNQPGGLPMYLLGIGDEGNGRAIVAYGNPDTSRNVAAYVPGLGTALDADFVEDTMKRAEDTAAGARLIDRSSASIVWLGYDAPQAADVMSRGDADRGAPAYNSFMAGLTATNRHSDPHLTAIGHSYGSLTVGTAARQAGGIPGADDVILLGSPGVGVERAEDLGVGKRHVFVGAAENDPVTKLPAKEEWLLAGPGALVYGEVYDRGNDDIYFGKDPASAAFGARRFEVDPGPHAVAELGGFAAHSQYFDPGVDVKSTNNIARIVGGQAHKITEEERR